MDAEPLLIWESVLKDVLLENNIKLYPHQLWLLEKVKEEMRYGRKEN